ncbi:Hsp20 family protein [Bradyrhizobium sp. SYSU BS000235]|uniref:Hsp20 family protein n=1 Tax=Bradyrhizobium sp. SYSU BS000235 TaxID=3411332 RepID=UPI003C714AE8
MRYDWTPLWRSTIGFDRLFDVFDEVQRTTEDNYPHYNIERMDENRFQISLALAGFSPDEISLTAEQNVLTVEGRKTAKDGDRLYLFRGISTRSFKRQFTLADHVEVKSAQFKDGLLVIDLVREVPEAMKPRQIAINAEKAMTPERIEAKAA